MQLYMCVEASDMQSAFANVIMAAVPRDFSDYGPAPAYLVKDVMDVRKIMIDRVPKYVTVAEDCCFTTLMLMKTDTDCYLLAVMWAQLYHSLDCLRHSRCCVLRSRQLKSIHVTAPTK